MDITLNIIVTVSSTGQLIKHKITVIATKLLLTFELISRQNDYTIIVQSAENSAGTKTKNIKTVENKIKNHNQNPHH